jgi:Tol biopolymer transport system component
MIGTTINHYRILEKIGSGGMGEIYLAEDVKLSRRVALKVLPAEFAASPDRLGRFEREAKAIAALNHPNIVTIHSIEQSDPGDGAAEAAAGKPLHFLTMELVTGKPLSAVIPKGGLELGRLLDLGLAMTEAMTAAHEKGITHRDLKPDNIMIGDDGRLKILDFGLAKLKEDATPAPDGSELPTQAVQTEDGRILGTVAYMAPEQAEGKPVDPRSDVFSMGVLLYEMATGERPFKGDTRISIISSIMRDTPTSVTELNRALPRHLGRIVKRCLSKEPNRRYSSARDLHNDLLELKEEIDSGELMAPSTAHPIARTNTGRWIGLAGAAIIVTLASVLAFVLFRPGGTQAPPATAPIEATITRITSEAGMETSPSISPDGRIVVYSSNIDGNWDIFLRRVEGEKVVNLTGDSSEDDYQPAFAPDGERIAFRSDRAGGGIFVMGGMGESVTRLTDGGFDPAWSPDGTEVLYATEGAFDPRNRGAISRLLAVDVGSRETRVVFDSQDAVQPAWSPHGHRIAYWGLLEGSGQRDIWTIPAAGGEPLAVTEDAATDWNPIWSPDGRFLYFSSDRGGSFNIWRVPIDEESGRVTGELQSVTTGSTDSGNLSISADGKRIAYFENNSSNNLQKVSFDPVEGKVIGEPAWVTRGSIMMFEVAMSPDEEWIAYYLNESRENLLLARTDGGGRRQLTDDDHKDRDPSWSPDGQQIVFFSDRTGKYELWTIQADGRGLRQLTDNPESAVVSPTWAPDDSRIGAYFEAGYAFVDPDLPPSEQQPDPLPAWNGTAGIIGVAAWSPDGAWLAVNFASVAPDGFQNEGFGVYSFESGEYTLLLEKNEPEGGFSALWLSDNRRLLVANEKKIYLVDRETREYRQIYELQSDELDLTLLSADDRTLYWMRENLDGDVWMLEIE